MARDYAAARALVQEKVVLASAKVQKMSPSGSLAAQKGKPGCLGRVVWPLGSLLVFLLALEIGLRIMNPFQSKNFDMVFNPKLGLVWETTNQGVWTSSCLFVDNIHTNSLGMRDLEHSKKAKGKRLMVFGDSFMEGFTVPDQDLFARQLEKVTGLETLNFSRSGWGTTHMLGAWKAVAKDFKPDVVILAFLQFNDLQDSYQGVLNPDFSNIFSAAHVRMENGQAVLVNPERRGLVLGSESGMKLSRYVYLLKLVRQLRDKFQGTQQAGVETHAPATVASVTSPSATLGEAELLADPYLGYRPVQAFQKKVWAYQAELFKAFQDEVRKSGAELVVMTVPGNVDQLPDPTPYLTSAISPIYKDMKLDLAGSHQYLLDMLDGLHIPTMDLYPAFKNTTSDLINGIPKYTLNCDNHWNSAGHKLAATQVKDWLKTQGLISP